MLHEPSDLSVDQVADLLRTWWGLDVNRVVYAPIGRGSHHWLAGRRDGDQSWFVIGDRLGPNRLRELTASARLVRDLSTSGCPFVVAPVPGVDSGLIRVVDQRWAVQVLPFVDGVSTDQDQPRWDDPGEQEAVARQVGWVHAYPVPDYLPDWETTPPHFELLETALRSLEEPVPRAAEWARRTRDHLLRHRGRVDALVARHDALVERSLIERDSWVVTHGEPDSDNILRTRDGRLMLIDWTTAARAPRERDLVAILHGSSEALSAYQETAGPVEPRRWALELMGLHWQLSHLARDLHFLLDPTRTAEDLSRTWHHYLRSLDHPPIAAI